MKWRRVWGTTQYWPKLPKPNTNFYLKCLSPIDVPAASDENEGCILRVTTQLLVPCTWALATVLFKADNSCFYRCLQYFASSYLCKKKKAIRVDSQHSPSTEEILVVKVGGSPLWDFNPYSCPCPAPKGYLHTKPFSYSGIEDLSFVRHGAVFFNKHFKI